MKKKSTHLLLLLLFATGLTGFAQETLVAVNTVPSQVNNVATTGSFSSKIARITVNSKPAKISSLSFWVNNAGVNAARTVKISLYKGVFQSLTAGNAYLTELVTGASVTGINANFNALTKVTANFFSPVLLEANTDYFVVFQVGSGPSSINLGITGFSSHFTVLNNALTPQIGIWRISPVATNAPMSLNTNVSYVSIEVTGTLADTYYRSIGNGTWSDPATWESSTDPDFAGAVTSPAAAAPDFNAGGVTIREGHVVTLDDQRTIDQTTVEGTLVVADNTALTLNNGAGTDLSVATGGSVVLQSTANGSASVAALPAGASISGNVTVQNYLSDRRAWRLLTVPLADANTIYEAWQNSQTYQPGTGTFITGPKGQNGLDEGKSYSLKVYDYASQALVDLPGTNVSLSSSLPYFPTRGYFLFGRGDRNPANLTPPNSNATTLSATGTLLTGDQVFLGSGSAGNLALVGNPYASPVDFNLLARNNVAKRFYVWLPTLNTVGGYVLVDDVNNTGSYTVTPAVGISTVLQSGQAFFVQVANSGAASLTFSESSKTTNGSSSPDRQATLASSFAIDLYEKNSEKATYIDGTVAQFADSYANHVSIEDAPKLENINENLALVRGAQALALERRPTVAGSDTLYLKLWHTARKNYRFTFSPANLATTLTATLIDTYLNTTTPLSTTQPTTVNFSINADAASAAPARFRVVLTSAATLPIAYTSVSALEKNAGIQLDWTIASEQGVHSYQVEKSTDGNNFTLLGQVVAKTNHATPASYSLLDVNAAKGSNYYRIRSVATSGATRTSQVVRVDIGTLKSTITAYPNPVANKVLTLQFANQPAGTYTVELIAASGQRIWQSKVVHQGGSATQTLSLPPATIRGTYQLKVSSGRQTTVQQLVTQ